VAYGVTPLAGELHQELEALAAADCVKKNMQKNITPLVNILSKRQVTDTRYCASVSYVGEKSPDALTVVAQCGTLWRKLVGKDTGVVSDESLSRPAVSQEHEQPHPEKLPALLNALPLQLQPGLS
jgi:hypothetical protein